ncbi:DUF2854 domain-containing protein [[Phormidium] sp. ETS-05]|uniref:DUF2854 domain-containing protein n=1 Tax=[Phormidium] sp. ETS-05 TaxID=222819 RepID=UPI0018EF0653|nr:DUF2854 domain-containing protein [[Phormidium] sp. ETS-05]
MKQAISLATVGLVVGTIITIGGFTAYALDKPILNLAGFFYGIPVVLIALALKTSELKPVPWTVPTSAAVLALREKQATKTQNQIRKDVTRFRYGQDRHLDDALARLGLGAKDDDRPMLAGLREVDTGGSYALVLEFESPKVPLEVWESKQEKMEKFFGPNVRVEIKPATSGAATEPEPRIEVAIITQA